MILMLNDERDDFVTSSTDLGFEIMQMQCPYSRLWNYVYSRIL